MKTITPETGFSLLCPRKREAHKGDYGALTAFCGSTFFRGAAALCVDSALRSGAGLVRLASIEEVIAGVAVRCPEAIFFPLAAKEGQIAWESPTEQAAVLSQKTTAYLVGCGCPKSEATARLARDLLQSGSQPLLLDAGALTSLFAFGDGALLKRAHGHTVVTPHLGEMSAMLGVPVKTIQAESERTALEFAQTYRCVTVLKSHRTVIATPEGATWESEFASCGLARGGSGDCLAGIIGSLLCQGYDPETAAVCGVWLHSAASRIVQERSSAFTMLPRELPDAVFAVFASHGW